MQDFRREFLDFAIQSGVLRFGQFTLKSGRSSPYFFNTGLFNSGNGLAQLGRFYARAILQSGIEFDMIFGPAYKGIPLATATVIALSDYHGLDIPYAFDRKEAKDHGEGGNIVGAPLQGKVLIIDDVITAGLSAAYSIDLIRENKAEAAGFIIALDRQEKTANSGTSALQLLQQKQNLPVFSIATLQDLVELLKQDSERAGPLSEIEAYREEYGC
ncbi:MAG: orotate phosphoribosyltransferase [Pseudomonadota bacterium]|nr:orotate phosphoribosyltransferase [Pseudomonadota bacterium]